MRYIGNKTNLLTNIEQVIPSFEKLKDKYKIDNVFNFLEQEEIKNIESKKFIYDNYSPNDYCERMYLTTENAQRIDLIRNYVEKWKNENLLSESEYFYLLASLIEGVPFVSNITGTYGAYLKQWDKRAFKKFEMIRLNVNNNHENNEIISEIGISKVKLAKYLGVSRQMDVIEKMQMN